MTGYCSGCGTTGECYCGREPTKLEELEQQLAEASKKLAEHQARIKVLEILLREVSGQPSIEYRLHKKIREALSTTSPTEALDKVVREANEEMRERCASLCEEAHDWDNNTLYNVAASIRRIEP